MIINFVTYSKSTGEALASGYGSEEVALSYESDKIGVVTCPDPIDHERIYVDLDKSQVIQIEKRPSHAHVFDANSKSWIIDSEKASSEIKLKRDRLLAETDWSQLPDVPDSIKQQYAEYRQELRDITKQDGFPYNVTFPKKP